uniref:Potassium channel tetramerisation-type BTB domain-containing protein n=1 Tax=Arcella intermedia TaxID=1963864 RepID=A0A6B2LCK1_9EUKA
MLGSENWKPDLNGYYFIDRDPIFFARILYFLRSGVWNLSGLSERDIELLKLELDYYLLSFHKDDDKGPSHLEDPPEAPSEPKVLNFKLSELSVSSLPVKPDNAISPKWIPTPKVTVSQDGKTTTNQTEGWNSVKTEAIPSSSSWTIEIVSIGSGNLGMIGAIPAQTFIPNGTHFSSCGGGIYQPNSEVYTDGTWNVEVYNNNNWSPIKVGSKIRYEWDKAGRKLVMFVDGTKTVQFGNVAESIVPCVAFYGVGSVVKFL